MESTPDRDLMTCGNQSPERAVSDALSQADGGGKGASPGGRQQAVGTTGRMRGFDDYEIALGDILRGERATRGKSLLDVQNELGIKAAYIVAIENADAHAFELPAFVPGYVRSYARYLKLDPEQVFTVFKAESGFASGAWTPKYGTSDFSGGSTPPPPRRDRKPARHRLGVAAGGRAFPERIEPAAIGSTLVLAMVVGGLGYGGWALLEEFQRVELAPVDGQVTALANYDPFIRRQVQDESAEGAKDGMNSLGPAGNVPVFTRGYDPPALDVPVVVPRDLPIAMLAPDTPTPLPQAEDAAHERAEAAQPLAIDMDDGDVRTETAAGEKSDALDMLIAEALGQPSNADTPATIESPHPVIFASGSAPLPQVFAAEGPRVVLVAARETWIRVRAADDSVLYQGMLKPGENWQVPQLETTPKMRVGNSGGLFLAVGGKTFGPMGGAGEVKSGIALDADVIMAAYPEADVEDDSELAVALASLVNQLGTND